VIEARIYARLNRGIAKKPREAKNENNDTNEADTMRA